MENRAMKKILSTLLVMILTAPVFAQPDPSVTLTSTSLGYPYTQPFTVKVSFSEPVTGFGVTDINIVNATVTNLVNNCNTKFTMTVTPTIPGPITMFVPANLVKSLSTGAPNKLSNKLNIIALNPAVNPSSNFDLSLWTLILPLPLSGIDVATTINNNTLIGHPTLNTGYSEPPYFFTDGVTGSMNFFAPLNGATTPGSVYPRCELSEYLPASPHSWTLATYTSNTLTGSLLIKQMPPSKKIVVGKIQDKGNTDPLGQIASSKPLVKIYYDLNQLDPNGNPCNGCIYARILPSPAQDNYLKTITLANNMALNEFFIYHITLLSDGTLTVKINNASTSYNLNTSTDNTLGWGSQELFFKAGVYIQDNGTSNAIGGQASFYSLQIKHVF